MSCNANSTLPRTVIHGKSEGSWNSTARSGPGRVTGRSLNRFSAVGPFEPGDEVQQRRLAASGWTDQADELPRRDVEADVVERLDPLPARRHIGLRYPEPRAWERAARPRARPREDGSRSCRHLRWLGRGKALILQNGIEVVKTIQARDVGRSLLQHSDGVRVVRDAHHRAFEGSHVKISFPHAPFRTRWSRPGRPRR